MTRGFHRVAMVDWSAAGGPKRGADSIWIAVAERGRLLSLDNPSTRAEATALVERLADAALCAGERLLVGFDFPFGWPSGAARALTGAADWRALWALIGDALEDGADNANNRFDLAAALNAAWADEGPFWGNGLKRDIAGLPRLKPKGYGAALPSYWRGVERAHRAAKLGGEALLGEPKSVWQLLGAGSVGGQALTGVAALERLRRRLGDAVEIWPFESGLRAPMKPIAFSEIYPSLWPITPRPGEVKDAAQARIVAEALSAAPTLDALFAGPKAASAAERARIETEEAWILGLDAALEEGLSHV